MSCCCYWIQTSRVLLLKHKTESSGMHNLYSLWSHGMSENLSDHVGMELRSVGMFFAEEEVGNLLVLQVKTFHTTHELSVNCPSPFPRRTHLGHVPPLKLRLISAPTCQLGCSHEKFHRRWRFHHFLARFLIGGRESNVRPLLRKTLMFASVTERRYTPAN